MNGEEKKYLIGGTEFVLADLTFGELRKIAPFEQKLRRMMQRVNALKEDAEVIEFTITLEQEVYSDGMLDFLNTILRPEKKSRMKEMFGCYRRAMGKITESVMQEALADFFTRKFAGKKSR